MSETRSEATQNTDELHESDFDFDTLADEVLGLEPDEATQEDVDATEELEGEDPSADEDADEVGEEERDEDEGEAEDEDESEEDATQDEEAEASDEADEISEIDPEFLVPIKVNGESSEVSMEELIANYQTKQHLSKKGDELAEQAKSLENTGKQAEVYAQVNAQLLKQEDEKDLRILKNLQEKVDKAFEEDDYEAAKLNNKLSKAKEEYSSRKSSRDSLMSNMTQALQNQQEEHFAKKVDHFNEVVKDLIPDWSEDVAKSNRKFALDIGLDEAVVDTMTDPMMVKAIDSFRRLSESSDKGSAKRKKTPVKRVPTKKPSSAATKKSNRVDDSRRKISKGRGTEKDDEVLFNNAIDEMFG